jgi:hypothetical protein
MDLYEVIVFNRCLTEAESSQVMEYLYGKYLPITTYADPSTIDAANLKAWYRPDLGVTVSSGVVSALLDQSGTGDANKDLAASGALRPTWNQSSSTYNYRPTMSFNGSMELEGPADWTATLAQPYTCYMVGEQDAAVTGYFSGGNVGSRAGILQNSGNVWSIYSGAGPVDAAVTTTTPHVMCAVFNGGSSAIYVTESGTASGSGNAGTQTLQRSTIGGLTSGVGGRMVGKVAEYIVYSGAHDSTKRQSVMNYLKSRYDR